MGAKEEGIALKDEGNKAFKAHDWLQALDYYSQAIAAYDREATFYSNRAAVQIKLESYGLAVADATSAIERDPNLVKVRRLASCADGTG